MSTWFNSFMQRAFPEAQVERLDWQDAYHVSIIVQHRDVLARRDETLREIHRKLTPRMPRAPRRRLHWGRR